jgi:hypothetical protein
MPKALILHGKCLGSFEVLPERQIQAENARQAKDWNQSFLEKDDPRIVQVCESHCEVTACCR